MKHLLEFREDLYKSTVQSITEIGLKLVEAANEMEKLRLPRPKPKDLIDGIFVQHVTDFYKKEWATNPAFKHISFDKYLEFVELDTTKLQQLETLYNQGKNSKLSYYKFNNLFFRRFEHKRGGEETLKKAGNKIELKYSELFKLQGDEVLVDLNEEYFKLYATSESQLEKITEIESFVKSARNLKVEYESIKSILGSLINDLSYDLSMVKINYHYLLQNI